MNTNRRGFLQAAATGAAAAVAGRGQAADPFAPAEAGLAERLFDKGRQHVLPVWAFDGYEPTPGVGASPPRLLKIPPAPRLIRQAAQPVLKADPDAFGDGLAPGMVLHGIAVEWGGTLIGGNEGKPNAWEAMKERVKPTAESEYKAGAVDTGMKNWGAYADLVRTYKVEMREILSPLLPDAPPALLYSYAGEVPGPTFRFRHGMPAVVRFDNKLQTEVSIHHHGGHNPSHSDGFPSFYALQGEAKDYLYPNILPLRQNGENVELDYGEGQSTTWYHDHGLDATAFNVSHGLAGFALWFDDLELKLIREGVLPGLGAVSAIDPDIASDGNLAQAWEKHAARELDQKRPASLLAKLFNDTPDSPGAFHPPIRTPYFNPYDLPLVLQDRVINPVTGQIVYDSDGHNGYIGDIQLVNGRPWPAVKVKRRKYRLRLLDGSNARIHRLRFLDGGTFGLRPDGNGGQEPANLPDATLVNRAMEFFRIGKDSWLWPTPRKVKSVLLNMANRADLIVDFKDWYEQARRAGRLVPDPNDPAKLVAEYYMVNTMPQFDGRGPKGKLAEDAGDPQVFPLPFALDPANQVVGNMAGAGVLPPDFLGTGPTGQMRELNQPVGLMKFIIEEDAGEGEDCPLWKDVHTILRPRHAIPDEDVMAVREFVFERGKGAWMVNARFYDPTISNACPVSGIKGKKFLKPDGNTANPAARASEHSLKYAEEWILRNGGGGWWHPIHIHLEAHQLIGYEKDFAADGLINADGVLGAIAQANMAGLPRWGRMVTEFGLDPLIVENGGAPAAPPAAPFTAVDRLLVLRAILLKPQLADPNHFEEAPIGGNPHLLAITLGHPVTERTGSGGTVEYLSGAAAALPLLRQGKPFRDTMALLPAPLRAQVDALLNDLDQLRETWAGEMTGNHDTQALGPNTAARIRMRFRTWHGPFVFHCHNVEHEDMRMMMNFEAVMQLAPDGTPTEPNGHDPDTAPAARTHGQAVTDMLTNPHAAGEMPWESIHGFPHFHEAPVPYTSTDSAGEPLIKPRPQQQ